MTLVLDRYFVHRLRMVTGKDGNPLNEVEMLCDSLMNNNGVLRDSNVIKFVPDQSVVKLHIGDTVGYSLQPPGVAYYLIVIAGVAASLGIIASTLPLLKRIIGPETARNE